MTDLNTTQTQIADAVGELLVSGGTDKNLNALIDLALDHTARRELSGFADYYQQHGRNIDNEVRRHIENQDLRREWLLDVQLAIRTNKHAPEAERQQSTDVSAMISDTLRDDLGKYFTDLLRKGSLAELYFLRECFMYWDTGGERDVEVSLAYNCNRALGGSSSFTKVSASHVPAVQKYVDALREIERKEV